MAHTLDELLEFAAQFSPELPRRIVGATPDEIAELEGHVGKPLPEMYKEYLRRLGRFPAGLRTFDDSYGSLPRLLSYYRDSKRLGNILPPNHVVSSVGGNHLLGSAIQVEHHSTADAAVFMCVDGKVFSNYADSFQKLLFRAAFIQFRAGWQHSKAGYSLRSAAPGILDQLQETIRQIGLAPLWFSDSLMLCAEAPGVAVTAERSGGNCHLRVVAPNLQQVQELGAVFQRDFAFKLIGMSPK